MVDASVTTPMKPPRLQRVGRQWRVKRLRKAGEREHHLRGNRMLKSKTLIAGTLPNYFKIWKGKDALPHGGMGMLKKQFPHLNLTSRTVQRLARIWFWLRTEEIIIPTTLAAVQNILSHLDVAMSIAVPLIEGLSEQKKNGWRSSRLARVWQRKVQVCPMPAMTECGSRRGQKCNLRKIYLPVV